MMQVCTPRRWRRGGGDGSDKSRLSWDTSRAKEEGERLSLGRCVGVTDEEEEEVKNQK